MQTWVLNSYQRVLFITNDSYKCVYGVLCFLFCNKQNLQNCPKLFFQNFYVFSQKKTICLTTYYVFCLLNKQLLLVLPSLNLFVYIIDFPWSFLFFFEDLFITSYNNFFLKCQIKIHYFY